MKRLTTDRQSFAEITGGDSPLLGLDIEFDPTGRITLICVAEGSSEDSYHGSSVSWENGRALVGEAVAKGKRLVGHAMVTVDAPRIGKDLGLEIPLTQLEDTYIWHYLLNADFCKTRETKDGNESRGTGQLDLWTMASIYTGLDQWKACRGGAFCVGPCPIHDPVGYNAMDGVAPVLALPRMREEAKAHGVTQGAYDHVARLSLVTEKMQSRGVKLDVPYLRNLEAKLNAQKANIFTFEDRPKIGKKGQELKSTEKHWFSDGEPVPFSPSTPKKVTEYFKGMGLRLASSDRDSIKKALTQANKTKGIDPAAVHWLERLLEWKGAGKGLDAWFGEKYIDALEYIHPRFIACGTSTGRMASSNPNFQNIPKHGDWAKDLRRALVPRHADLELLRADSKQLELRMVLYLAGVTADYGDDAFAWLVREAWDLIEEGTQNVSEVRYRNPKLHESGVPKGHRELAKRISHAGSYLEGFVHLYPSDLQRARTADAVRAGALVIYEDWEYAGGVVGFTGANLATDLFGDAGWANRKKALALQEAYFRRFPAIRSWHRTVTGFAERGSIVSPCGRYLALRGDPAENAKDGSAFLGQGMGADYIQRGMIALDDAGYTPLINIHDENVVEISSSMSDNDARDLMGLMSQEFSDIPGFRCPIDVVRGPNYVDVRSI
jgi:DNA polymerase I-like protein with 3'-5' exonuclease and polymerase domains